MNIDQFYESMSDIVYGWVDKGGGKHSEVYEKFDDDYRLQDAGEVEKSRIGVCWDQVEFERRYFEENGIAHGTYSLTYYTDAKCPNHTFLIFEQGGKWHWFEHSWEENRGIREYASKNELLKDVVCKFIPTVANFSDPSSLCLYRYAKPPKSLGVLDFYKWFEGGEQIQLECVLK